MRVARKLHWMFLSLFALGVVYANLATLSQCMRFAKKRVALPLPGTVLNIFLIHGVFGTFSTNATEVTFWGLAESAKGDTNRWELLRTEDFFPYGRGERGSRMEMLRMQYTGETNRFALAAMDLGGRLKRRYNRLHPNDPLAQIGMRNESWPLSPKGYGTYRGKGMGVHEFWVICEDESHRGAGKSRR